MDSVADKGAVQSPDTTGQRLTKNPDFWRLWTVGLVIFVVRWTEMLATAVFAYQETGSAFVVAMLTMLRMLPMGLFGTFVGVLADRLERRTALLAIVASMLLTSAAIALLAHFGLLEVWHLAVASFINGMAWASDNPVRRMMIGEVVGSDRMGMAMSIDVGANNASRFVGPALGGLLLAFAGIQGVFGFGAILYFIALFAGARLRYRNAIAVPSGAFIFTQIADGLRLAWKTPAMRATLFITIVFNIFGWPFSSMIPVIARDRFHLSPDEIGLLASMDGIGAFFGALAVGAFVRSEHYSRVYFGSVVCYLTLIMVYSWSPTPLSAAVALFITGFTQSGFSIMQATLVFLAAPPEMRARMLGVLSFCIGLGPIGFLHIGLLADAIGAPWTSVVTGIEGLLAIALTHKIWRPLWRQT